MNKLAHILLLLIVSFFLLQACQDTEQKQQKKIKQLEEELFGNLTGIPDREKSLTLVNAYVEFAEKFPDHDQAAEYLFRAAEICMNTGYPERAVELYTQVYRDYPAHEKQAESLFLIAFTYENQLSDLQKAEHTYKQFIELFPDHELADDAKVLLQHLGKSPDELVREFEERLRAQEGL